MEYPVADVQNGFRAINTQVARKLNLKENSHSIEQEMVMKCAKQGYRLAEVPSHEYERRHGKSTIKLKSNPGLTSGESSHACFACPTPSEPSSSTDLRPQIYGGTIKNGLGSFCVVFSEELFLNHDGPTLFKFS
jgi:hypothetical protein